MSSPAFPSATDARLQELLSRALALPADAPSEAPANQAIDDGIDLDACRRAVKEALEWAARSVDKWFAWRLGAAAPSPDGKHEGGGVISRFFRRVSGWLKSGFSCAWGLLVRGKDAVLSMFGVKRKAPAAEAAPSQSATATEAARAPEERRASPTTTSADVAAKVTRGVLSHLAHDAVRVVATDMAAGGESGVFGSYLSAEVLGSIERVLSTSAGRAWTQEQMAKQGHAAGVG
jgi:hypothetical protein